MPKIYININLLQKTTSVVLAAIRDDVANIYETQLSTPTISSLSRSRRFSKLRIIIVPEIETKV